MTFVDFKTETDNFYSFLFKHYQVLSSVPSNKCSLQENKFNYRGWDLTCKGKTLVCQFIVSDRTDPATWILSLAIYNLRFDKEGRPLDSRGLPMNDFSVDKERLAFCEYSFSEKAGKFFWTEYIKDDISEPTNKLVHDWVTKLCS